MLLGLQVLGVPHLGGLDADVTGLFLYIKCPVPAPFRRLIGLVVHAVEHVGIGEGAGEQFTDLGALVFEQ